MYISAYLILAICLTSASKELKIISKTKTTIVDNTLYISWNVNSGLHSGVYDPIKFEVKYCPLDIYQFPQDCRGVTVNLCKATFSRRPFKSGNISIQEDELTDFLMSADRINLFLKNSTASISSEWNEITGQFICAVHNIDECWVAYPGPFSRTAAIKAQVLINASTIDHQEETLLAIKQNQLEVSKYLNQPKNIVLVQNGTNAVTVKWKTCPFDNPFGFNITFDEEGGEILNCGLNLNDEDYHRRDWECSCKLPLRPYTNYTVSVYSYSGLNHKLAMSPSIRSLAGVKTFRTHEQAPSLPPSIECAVCQEDKLNDSYRIVKVKWKLPPKDKLNGFVRQTILKYWARNDSENEIKMTYPNMKTEKYLILRINVNYFVQVKICTLKNLCSHYSEKVDISKVPDEFVPTEASEGPQSVNKMVIAAPVIIVLVVILAFILYRRIQRKEKRKLIDPLETLSEDIGTKNESNETKDISGSLHSKESEYNELPEALNEASNNED